MGNTTTTTSPEDEEEEDEPNIYQCDDGQELVLDNYCYLNEYDTLTKQLRGISEVILVIWSVVYLGIAVREFSFLPVKIFMQNMALCPSRVGFLIGK